MNRISVVFPKLHLATILPGENDPLGIDDFQFAGDEAWIAKFFLGHLTLADAGADVRAERDRPSRHMLIARDFDGDDLLAELGNLDDLIVMTAIVADPFPGKIEDFRLTLGCSRRLNHLPFICHKPARAQSSVAKFSTEESFGNARHTV